VREELNPELATTAICSKLATRPQICKEIVQNLKWRDNQINMTRYGISEILVFFIVIVILFFVVYFAIKVIAQ
jgi:hypothetical protein